MALTPDKPSGYYPNPIVINWVFDAINNSAKFTSGDVPPAISKYIAYDTLTPPNPFISVTEDGRGRVVYDGGFPKFYNGSWNNAVNFAGLVPAHKYLYNAIKWVENKTKWNAGNRSILILGDATSAEGYSIKKTNSADWASFNTTLTGICQVAGYTNIVFKDRSDWPNDNPGGTINVRLAELENYALVIFMSTAYLDYGNPLITTNCVNDLVTYRENGNGIIIITDHGTVINDFATASDFAGTDDNGFFTSGNKIATRFGAWFSGNYDRTPVNVGFLRSTYGDHPLYNGMSNTDSVAAGLSESRVNTITTPPLALNPVKRVRAITAYGDNGCTPMHVELMDCPGKAILDADGFSLTEARLPGTFPTFNSLPGRLKILHNSLAYVADPARVASKGKKILVISDFVTGDQQAYSNAASAGMFNANLQKVATLLGYSIDNVNINNYGSQLNTTYAELDNYPIVILWSLSAAPYYTRRITDACIDAINAYRQSGGGFIGITDVGPSFETPEEALAGLSTNFTTSSTSTLNRFLLRTGFSTFAYGFPVGKTTTTVAQTKARVGDHPVLANMADTDTILNDDGWHSVFKSLWFTSVAATGVNKVNSLVVNTDGSFTTYKFAYSIAAGDLLDFKDANGNSFQSVGDTTVVLGSKNSFALMPIVNGAGLGTVWGEIKHNGKRVGTLVYDTVSKVTVHANDNPAQSFRNFYAKDGDIVTVEIQKPFVYSKRIIVKRNAFSKPNELGAATKLQSITKGHSTVEHKAASGTQQVNNVIKPNMQSSQQTQPLGLASQLNRIQQFENNETLLPPIESIPIYATQTQAQTYITSIGSNVPMNLMFFVAENNRAYGYKDGVVALLTETPYEVVMGNRIMKDTASGISYGFDSNKKLVKV